MTAPLLTNATLKARRTVAFERRGQAVTYKKFSTESLNTKTGGYSVTYVSTSCTRVIVGQVDPHLVKESGGRYTYEDLAFRWLVEDLPETPPSKKSRLVLGSQEYEIVGYHYSGDTNVMVIIARGL